MTFNHTLRYINGGLSINNHNFHNYVHLIYPDEIEINCTTEPDKFASYIDILLNIGSNDRLITTICDKRDDFDFAIVSFPFLCSNISFSPAYGVYISQLILYARACFDMRTFQKRRKVDIAGLYKSNLFANSTIAIMTLFVNTNYHLPIC